METFVNSMFFTIAGLRAFWVSQASAYGNGARLELERSRQKLRVAGSIPAASMQDNPPLSSALPLRKGAGLAFRDQIGSWRTKSGPNLERIGRMEELLRGGG
jgi:hypothetical protein